MNNKYLEFYFIAGTISLLFLVFQLLATYPDSNPATIFLTWITSLVFYFLALKAYNEKKDEEVWERVVFV